MRPAKSLALADGRDVYVLRFETAGMLKTGREVDFWGEFEHICDANTDDVQSPTNSRRRWCPRLSRELSSTPTWQRLPYLCLSFLYDDPACLTEQLGIFNGHHVPGQHLDASAG